MEQMDHKKQSIVTSRTFPGMFSTVEELTPHVANYAARCALKLRRQKSVCALLSVFARTNPFREDLPQYSGFASHLFTTPTSNTGEVVQAALKALREMFRPGFQYKRAGVIVERISSGEAVQPDLFDFNPGRRYKLDAVACAMDRINASMGNDTVFLASQQYPEKELPAGNNVEERKGVKGEKSVKFSKAIKRDSLSPEYSTKLGDFLVK